MSVTVVAGYFGRDPRFERMARVLAYSAVVHCPHWTHRIGVVAPRPVIAGPAAGERQIANTQKMLHWCDAVAAMPDGARAVLLDVDTFIAAPFGDVWDQPFDVAYTTKAGTRIPFNTGVLFVRATPAARAFLRAWRDQQLAMLADGRDPVSLAWRRMMVGIHQAALAATLDTLGVNPTLDTPADVEVALGAHRVHLHRLPCRVWNCEDESWPTFDGDTRIVHCKGALREAIVGEGGATSPAVRRLARLWRDYELAATHGQSA